MPFKPLTRKVIEDYQNGKYLTNASYFPDGKENNPHLLTEQEIVEMYNGFFSPVGFPTLIRQCCMLLNAGWKKINYGYLESIYIHSDLSTLQKRLI